MTSSIDSSVLDMDELALVRLIGNNKASIACLWNRPELVDGLFDDKSNVYFGLLGACLGGHSDLVDRLIELSASGVEHFNEIDTYDRALTAAAAGGHRAIVDRLLDCARRELYFDAGDHEGALFAACEHGRLELAEYLVGLGICPCVGLDGACFGGQTKIARRMIELGGIVTESTIWAAKCGGNEGMVAALTVA